MTDAQYILISLVGGLGAIAFFMIKSWAKSWDTRLAAHDHRIGRHDVQIATITANMEHIRVTGDETRDDVKILLRRSSGVKADNGARSSG